MSFPYNAATQFDALLNMVGSWWACIAAPNADANTFVITGMRGTLRSLSLCVTRETDNNLRFVFVCSVFVNSAYCVLLGVPPETQ